MEATMTYGSEHSAIGFGGAFARQFRFLWTSRRPLLLAVALLAIMVLAGEPWTDDPKMRLLTVWPVWLVIVPLIWAFAVFHNEGPDNRFYFWAQPTGRVQHTLARIGAGLAWLWIMYGGLIVVGALMGVMDGDAWQLGEIGVAGWVNLFTGPLITYLAICILTVPSDYPIRWFFGFIFLFPLLVSVFVEWLDMEDVVETVLRPLGDESWGLGITMIGGFAREIAELDQTLREMSGGNPGQLNFDAAELWWVATPLWVALFVGIVVFIASRHPDTLPKWRGFRR